MLHTLVSHFTLEVSFMKIGLQICIILNLGVMRSDLVILVAHMQ